ncbi:MAG: phosphatidylserine decarboxylase [Thermoplasmata archaeon]
MIAPGARRWVVPPWAAAFVLAALVFVHLLPRSLAVGIAVLALVALAGFFTIFFRDPDRAVGDGVVSAADGRVREVTREGDRWRVSVFMNVTDVHVNRAPYASRVLTIEDGGEGFRPAYTVDAAHNVQRRFELSTTLGPVEVIQMTGIVARRLVSLVPPGTDLAKGQRFGMIVLGSRVDVLLPASCCVPRVRKGDRVWAGTSSIAEVRL